MSLMIVVLALIAGCMIGWLAHQRIVQNRVTVNPVHDNEGWIVGYTVNVGKPIAGHFDYGERPKAEHHAERIRNAFTGRAREERRTHGSNQRGGPA